MIIDLGTGDGAAVLRAARQSSRALVIGIDTDAASLREASHRAARPAAKGGLSNVMFLAGDASDIASVVAGAADEVRITLPWGSLLRVALCPDEAFGGAVAAALRPGGTVRMLLSLTERDATNVGAATLDDDGIGRIAGRYAPYGLTAVDARPATRDDVETLGSSWAKRLGIPERRDAWLIELERDSHNEGTKPPSPHVLRP